MLKIVRIHEIKHLHIIAFFDVETEDFRINGFKLVKSNYGGYYIGMPQNINRWNVVSPLNTEIIHELKIQIENAINININNSKEDKTSNGEVEINDNEKVTNVKFLTYEDENSLDNYELIDKYLRIYQDLEHGRRNPQNTCEEDFVNACLGLSTIKSRHAIAYITYKRRMTEKMEAGKSKSAPDYWTADWDVIK